jgi:crotonobetainyl-CoA:carnitine CoA-transferase CaiB-like acyl-CoA transferase
MMDHGPLSGIRRTSTPTQRRKEAAGIERTIDQALAEVKAERAAEDAERAAAYAERTKAVPFTEDELSAARVVRTMYGWERVLRVNTKTVRVHGSFGDYLVPKKTILEVRK